MTNWNHSHTKLSIICKITIGYVIDHPNLDCYKIHCVPVSPVICGKFLKVYITRYVLSDITLCVFHWWPYKNKLTITKSISRTWVRTGIEEYATPSDFFSNIATSQYRRVIWRAINDFVLKKEHTVLDKLLGCWQKRWRQRPCFVLLAACQQCACFQRIQRITYQQLDPPLNYGHGHSSPMVSQTLPVRLVPCSSLR